MAQGKVFGGCEKDLDFTPPVSICPTSVIEVERRFVQTMKSIVNSSTQISSAKTEREFLDYFKKESNDLRTSLEERVKLLEEAEKEKEKEMNDLRDDLKRVT